MYDELMPVAKKVKTGDDMYIGMYMMLTVYQHCQLECLCLTEIKNA